jgi:hypothetical protein
VEKEVLNKNKKKLIFMDLIIYLIGFIFAALILWLGNRNTNFGFLYLGFFIIILLGLMLSQYGLSIASGSTVTDVGGDFIIQTTYQTYTIAENWLLNLIHLVFILGGAVMIMLSTYSAFRG